MDTSKSNYNLVNQARPKRRSLPRLVVGAILVVLIAVVALPSYWSGEWSWSNPPQIDNISKIKSLRTTGLDIPGWETLDQAQISLGGHDWSIQLITKEQPKPVSLLLLPQNYYRNQPGVEWMDIRGVQRWRADSYNQLNFPVSQGGQKVAQVKARFFRAWNSRQTFAVVQWYAWPNGGHFMPAKWFWADQLAQLRGERNPWVAVSIIMPMEPLGDLEAVEPMARSLAQAVQTSLRTDAFSE